jgi:hypothetical protein
MTGVTYRQLDAVLRHFGFQAREPEPDTRVYKHFGSGALFITPINPDDEEAHMRHYMAAQLICDVWGIATQQEFEQAIRETS